MALLSSIDESTFTELSKRFHQKLKQQHNLTLSLGQFRELMIQAVGHRSLHDSRQVWRQTTTPSAEASASGNTLDEAQHEALMHDFALQGNLLFWEEIGIPEPGTRDNPHPTAPGAQHAPRKG